MHWLYKPLSGNSHKFYISHEWLYSVLTSNSLIIRFFIQCGFHVNLESVISYRLVVKSCGHHKPPHRDWAPLSPHWTAVPAPRWCTLEAWSSRWCWSGPWLLLGSQSLGEKRTKCVKTWGENLFKSGGKGPKNILKSGGVGENVKIWVNREKLGEKYIFMHLCSRKTGFLHQRELVKCNLKAVYA